VRIEQHDLGIAVPRQIAFDRRGWIVRCEESLHVSARPWIGLLEKCAPISAAECALRGRVEAEVLPEGIHENPDDAGHRMEARSSVKETDRATSAQILTASKNSGWSWTCAGSP